MCFHQKFFGTKKANNSNNNIVRVYGDVIHTGQDLVYKLSDCQSFNDAFRQTGEENFKTIRTEQSQRA